MVPLFKQPHQSEKSQDVKPKFPEVIRQSLRKLKSTSEQVKKEEEIEALNKKIEKLKKEVDRLYTQLKAHKEKEASSLTLAENVSGLGGAAYGIWVWLTYVKRPVEELLFPLLTGGPIGRYIHFTLYGLPLAISVMGYGWAGGVLGRELWRKLHQHKEESIKKSIAEKQSEIGKLEEKLTRLEKELEKG